MDYRAFGIPFHPGNGPFLHRLDHRRRGPDPGMNSWGCSRDNVGNVNRRQATQAIASRVVRAPAPMPSANARLQPPHATWTTQATKTKTTTTTTKTTTTRRATPTTKTVRIMPPEQASPPKTETPANKMHVTCPGKQSANQRVIRFPMARVLPPVGVHLGAKLGDLVEELCHVLSTYEFVLRDFERAIEGIKAFTDESMVNVMWIEKISQTYYRTGQQDKVEGAVQKIFNSTVAVKQAIPRRSAVDPSKRDQVDCQIRAANTAVAACESIIDLASRAYYQRTACKDLVREIEETISKLDPGAHPCIYMDQKN